MQYRITSKARADHGVWEGATPAAALLAMHRAAGYNANDVDIDLDGKSLWFRDLETEQMCGDVDAWTIEEV